MLLYLIPLIILAASLIGITVIIIKKMPLIAGLPIETMAEQKSVINENGKKIVEAVKDKINFEKLLQKILSKTTVSALKIGNKTSAWLAHLRQKAKKEKDTYWEKIQAKKDKNQTQK